MAESQGMFATFLHFGNVKIQTAGTEERLMLESVPESFAVAAKINNLIKYVPKEGLMR
jgi:hypothetical protein